MNNFFSKIACVNLARRPDKWAECEAEFSKHGFVVERFDAIEGNPIGYEGRLPDGAIGNLLSHIEIIKKAKEEGLDNVLILEDDIEFDDNLSLLFHEWVVGVPKDWDLLYLGGNHNLQEKVLVAPHVRKIVDTYTTHAYCVRSTVYETVLDVLSDFSSEGDVLMTEVQKVSNSFCFTPNIAWQRPSFSDVFNRDVDYKFLRNKDNNSSKDA